MEKNKIRLLENLVDDFIRNFRNALFYLFLICFGFLLAYSINAKNIEKQQEKKEKITVVYIITPCKLPSSGAIK